MEPLQFIGALNEISPVEFALAVVVILLSIVGGFAGFLWTRWMTRQETRIDVVEARQWGMLERASTKEDMRDMSRHLDDRLDRLEARIDYSTGVPRPAE